MLPGPQAVSTDNMTIPATTAWGSATGTGITGPYAIPFPLYSQSHLTVKTVANGVVTTMALGTDYTFTSWTPDNKGQVASPAITFNSVVAGGTLIVFLLTPPGTQLTAITQQSSFFPALHEVEYDLEAQKTLQLLQWAGKTIKAPDQEYAGQTSLDLPPIASRANLFLGFDANGNIQMSSQIGTLAYSGWVAFVGGGEWAGCTFNGFWRRVGDSIEVTEEIVSNGAPGNANFNVNLPNGLQANLAKMVYSGGNLVPIGSAVIQDGSNGNIYGATVTLFGAGPNNAIYVFQGNPLVYVTKIAPFDISMGGGRVNLRYKVPIVGWS